MTRDKRAWPSLNMRLPFHGNKYCAYHSRIVEFLKKGVFSVLFVRDKDEESSIYWLKSKGNLRISVDCGKCGSSCHFVKRKDSFCWKCPKRGCLSIISMRDGSFFKGSHLKLNEILELSYWWANGASVTRAMHETGHSSRTVVDWYNFHRDVCAQYFLDHPVVVGGVGKVVEIDESKFGNRKYNRGRYKEGHWVFGGVERGDTNDVFMVEVNDRSAANYYPSFRCM